MEIDHERRGKIDVVHLKGRLVLGDGNTDLCDRSREMLAEGVRRIVIDLTDVSYVDSAGIGELVACAKRAGDAGAVIRLAARDDGPVRRVLTVTCLDRVFDVHTDVDAAVSAFA